MHSRLFNTAGVAASLLALFCLLGGHWIALQSVAWTGMLAGFATNHSWSVAITKTFDGNHPCKLCSGIQDGRQKEEQERREVPWMQLQKSPELICVIRQTTIPLAPMTVVTVSGFVTRHHQDFVESPPTPPPRFIAAS